MVHIVNKVLSTEWVNEKWARIMTWVYKFIGFEFTTHYILQRYKPININNAVDTHANLKLVELGLFVSFCGVTGMSLTKKCSWNPSYKSLSLTS